MFKKLKAVALNKVERFGWFSALQRLDPKPHRLYVLAYHRVDWPDRRPWLDPLQRSSDPDHFAEQMKLISRHYQPLTASEMLDCWRDRRAFPKNSVLVTVDDGYRDFQEHIFPIARSYGVNPVLFVPTGYVGRGGFWWDKLYQAIFLNQQQEITTSMGRFSLKTDQDRQKAYTSINHSIKHISSEQAQQEIASWNSRLEEGAQDTLTWDELRDLSQAGATIAPHTHSHPILSRLSLGQALEEAILSRKQIVEQIGFCPPLFAFPDGQPDAFTPELGRSLREEGFVLVFTMLEGTIHSNQQDPMRLPRIAIWPTMNLAQFHWRLSALHYV